MPELPEVETIVKYLKTKVRHRTFVNVWTDCPKLIKKPHSFNEFKKILVGEKIIDIQRRGKNILFELSRDKVLLVHQKMTGHLLYGKWKFNEKWQSEVSGPLSDDPGNGFLHLMFFLSDKSQLALSDLRKFAKVELWDKKELYESEYMKSLGPEPLEKSFTFKKFKEIIKKRGRIKQVLMDQSVIVGIGNIYSDEILWLAKVHPLKDVSKLTESDLKRIYSAIPKVLKKSLSLKGDSMQDYRLPNGKKGGYQNFQMVYHREGKKCLREDGGTIKRIKIGGRSAHFCPKCQKP